ncbi:hypothetical protein TNCV_4315591 [Trichonephila clavipes]|nr:hypothetical protein TNCV_4315591 [Trichonephila clavipes]
MRNSCPAHILILSSCETDRKVLCAIKNFSIDFRASQRHRLVAGLSNEFEPTAAKDSPCRGRRYTLNMSRLKHPSMVRCERIYNTPLVPSQRQTTALGLISVLFVRNTDTLPAHLESNGARILVQHLDTLVHHTPLLLKAIFLTSAEVTVFFLDRLRLLSMGSGTPLTIMTASLRVSASPSDSIETLRNVVDRAKLTSFLSTLLATWRLIEWCRSLYVVPPSGGELQQRG